MMEDEDKYTDIGDNHRIRVLEYKDQKAGINIRHKRPGTDIDCEGFVAFDNGTWAQEFDNKITVWQVQSMDPLTLSPSILCSCGDHGFIENGKWRKA